VMRRAVIFVLSDVRSGSTLLDQCLGGHPDIVSLGEVHWLRAYSTEDRRIYNPVHALVCSCGLRVRECPFWRQVEQLLGRPLDSLNLRIAMRVRHRRAGETAIRRGLIRLIGTAPGLFRLSVVRAALGGPKVARDCIDLYNAVSGASSKRICVDSSKSPYRFRAVFGIEPQKTHAIILVRDYRAVVHSKMKRGQALQKAAVGWRKKMIEIDSLTKDLPDSSVHFLKYEAFCADPKRELRKVCAFLGVEFSETMLQRSSEHMHHVGGSPSKFDPARGRIALDRSYERQFSQNALCEIRELVGDVASRWGY
jgi:Sulfotransferase family